MAAASGPEQTQEPEPEPEPENLSSITMNIITADESPGSL